MRFKKYFFKRGKIDFSLLLHLDEQHRKILTEINDLRAERNRVSEEIAHVKRSGGDAANAIATMREVGGQIKLLETKAVELQEEIRSILELIPNVPHESVPKGNCEKDNKVVKEWGERPVFDFSIKDHIELGSSLGLFDFERSAKYPARDFLYLLDKGLSWNEPSLILCLIFM